MVFRVEKDCFPLRVSLFTRNATFNIRNNVVIVFGIVPIVRVTPHIYIHDGAAGFCLGSPHSPKLTVKGGFTLFFFLLQRVFLILHYYLFKFKNYDYIQPGSSYLKFFNLTISVVCDRLVTCYFASTVELRGAINFSNICHLFRRAVRSSLVLRPPWLRRCCL